MLSASPTGSSGSKREAFRHHGNRRFPYDPEAVASNRLYMQREGIEYLYSFDDDFDALGGITRLETPDNPFA
jgi:hypothetical protein